jgi:hypothetical protein
MVKDLWGNATRAAVSYEASEECSVAIKAAKGQQAQIATPHPKPFDAAPRLGRLRTVGAPVPEFESWSGPPTEPAEEEAYDLRQPLRDMQERIRAHTIEQARLDEIGRLKAGAEFESAQNWQWMQHSGAADQPELGGGPRLASEHQDNLSPGEAPRARQDRRLCRLRAIGGDFVPHGNGWRSNGTRGALAQLIREEASSGAPMNDKTNIRDDLAAAVTREAGNC